MAEKRLQTQILLRYATYEQWMNSEIILGPGEVAIAAFPNESRYAPPDAVGIKVGTGEHYFFELPWIQAVAADVYNWAKTPQPPAASTIPGLDTYIANYLNEHSIGGGGDASSQYRIIYDSNELKYILQQWNDETNQWQNTTSEIDMNDIFTRLNAIEHWANGGYDNLGNIDNPLSQIVDDAVFNSLEHVQVNDIPVEHQFVTAVRQDNGTITVSRSPIAAMDITSGTLTTEQGGTGFSSVEGNELLVGSDEGILKKRTFVTEIDPSDKNSFATVGAIIKYVADATSGLTGAMHFVGEATVPIYLNNSGYSNQNPYIEGYNFLQAALGDVILANDAQEYVWTDFGWRLLGDEGSYAVKGSITNEDIADNANIDQFKINGLEDALENKFDASAGQALKDKLDTIEEGAQQNIIEAITLNGVTVEPDDHKTINLELNIDSMVKTITIQDETYVPNANHNITLPISTIGLTGQIEDLQQAPNSYVVFNCGTSTISI